MMTFKFDNGCKLTEALVTGMKYHENSKTYELTVFGIDEDGISYTQTGKAWFETEDFDELIEAGEFEFPHEIIGRKLKLVANGTKEYDLDEKINLNKQFEFAKKSEFDAESYFYEESDVE